MHTKATGSLTLRVPSQRAESGMGPPTTVSSALQVTSNEKHLESLKGAGSLLRALQRLAPAGE